MSKVATVCTIQRGTPLPGLLRDQSGLHWGDDDLAAQRPGQDTLPWVIAYWHHPPYTKGSHDSDTESELIEMRQNALPILEQRGTWC